MIQELGEPTVAVRRPLKALTTLGQCQVGSRTTQNIHLLAEILAV